MLVVIIYRTGLKYSGWTVSNYDYHKEFIVGNVGQQLDFTSYQRLCSFMMVVTTFGKAMPSCGAIVSPISTELAFSLCQF